MPGYTIRIFVPEGDPEGLRVITQMNWTGVGVVFPRAFWTAVRSRPEFERTGVYILVGYGEADDDLPRVYVGEGDGVRERIERHVATKEFWSWAVVFTGALNKAHVQWLEHTLVERAAAAGQCSLENGNAPQAPYLSEHDESDVASFLEHMLRILPLIKLNAFEKPKPVVVSESLPPPPLDTPDTIVVPAQREGFERVFLHEHQWYAVRVAGAMLDKIKFRAAYQTSPVSAVTHIAAAKQIEPYGESYKYRLIFSEAPKTIAPIPFADAAPAAMRGAQYTRHHKLKMAKKLSELF